jgi:glycosyltransferase involved in cell wall biosynthesis
MKLFTIVIPTHSRSAQLSDCINSILLQASHPQPPIIVIDDGSAEKHARCNEEYCKKNNLHYVFQPQAAGPAAARNRGIELANSQWVVFLDDDVIVGRSWLERITQRLSTCPSSCAGVEGKVEPSGNGLWDKEVMNLTGGAFLSCHIAYRRDLLLLEKGFDQQFKGPFCEDHELAARILCHGEILFENDIQVTHQPRSFSRLKYFLSSSKRVKVQLESEYHFFSKHPDRYHAFRKSRTFSGTIISSCFYPIYQELKRRTFKQLRENIPDSTLLLITVLFEQFFAMIWLMRHASFFFNQISPFFYSAIDTGKTCSLWKTSQPDLKRFAMKRNAFNAATFRSFHQPVYNAYHTHKRAGSGSQCNSCQVFIRIDDLFFDNIEAIDLFTSILKKLKISVMTAVRGNDILKKEYLPLLNQLKGAGIFIGIHGFTHEGTCGPFSSELLQMNYCLFETQICPVIKTLHSLEQNHAILIPPFNAISRNQIVRWSELCSIICGGPETARFTDQVYGPVALSDGGWYFPSIQPFYGNAGLMLKKGVPALTGTLKGPLCLTMHFTDELKDNFRSFTNLLERVHPFIHCWEETENW